MWTTGSIISSNRALCPASSLEVGALPSFSFQSALQRQINFLRFLDSLLATLRCLWNSSILFNKFSFEEHVLILKCFSWVEWFFPWGVFLEILGGGVRPDSPNSNVTGLFLIQLEPIDKYVHTPPKVPLKLYPIPDQSLYPFSFRPKPLKIYSLWRGTYRYHSLYKGSIQPVKKKKKV